MPRHSTSSTRDTRPISRDLAINSLDFALQAIVWVGIFGIALALAVGF